MARPKTLKAEAISSSTVELLERLKRAVRDAGIEAADGTLIDDFDPLETLAKISADPRVKYDLRIAAAREVASYLYPKQKTVEVRGSADEPIRVIIADNYKQARQERLVDSLKSIPSEESRRPSPSKTTSLDRD